MRQFVILHDLGYVILGAAVCVLVARVVRMPPIMAYILAGLALGPLTGLMGPSESVERFSEIGIALLLFLVGLELSLDSIRGVGRAALLGGTLQVVLTAAAALALTTMLGFDVRSAALLSLGITFSSTVVVVKLLDQRGDLHALYGRIAVGILLVQDLVVILVLTLLTGIGAGAEPGLGGLAIGVARAFGGMALLGATAYVAARWLLPRPFAWLARALDALFICSLCWCFLFIIAAERLQLSVEVGAFLAGVTLAQLPYNHELRRRVQPLVNLFIAIFFVTLGMHMELGDALAQWAPALALSALVLLGKPLIVMIIMARLGQDERTSFLTSVALGQISEFCFIIAGLGVSARLLDEGAISLVGLVGIITIGVSSYLVTYGPVLYEALRRRGWLAFLRAPGDRIGQDEQPPRGHIIVVGMNSLGRRIIHTLLERGEHVVVIDTDPAKLRSLRTATVLGSAGDEAVLAEANLSEARVVISALQIEDINALLAYRCRQLGVPVSVHAFDPALIPELEEIGVDYLIVSKHDGIRQVAAALRQAGVGP